MPPPPVHVDAAPGPGAVPAKGGDHRSRLLAGMVAALVEKGYAAVTIADVARKARVSKRTFYEHFADKQACFLAAYAAGGERLLRVIDEAADPDLDWTEQVRAAVHAYLSALQNEPVLTRTMLLEIQSAGPDALRLRRQVNQRFAAQLIALVERGRPRSLEPGPLTPALATAVIGGVNELVLAAVEEGREDQLTELASTAVDLIRAVLTLR